MTFLCTVWNPSKLWNFYSKIFSLFLKIFLRNKYVLKFKISLHKILFATRVEMKLFSHSWYFTTRAKKSFISSVVSKIIIMQFDIEISSFELDLRIGMRQISTLFWKQCETSFFSKPAFVTVRKGFFIAQWQCYNELLLHC